jgi:hypothetical protein
VGVPEIMEAILEESRRSPSSPVKPGWNRRTIAGKRNLSQVSRKSSSMSTTTSTSAATTKSLSSKTDFTLPSPTNSRGKSKWDSSIHQACESGNSTELSEANEYGNSRLEYDDYFFRKNQQLQQHSNQTRKETGQKPNSEQTQSIRSEFSSTSYGSVTLGGATSLSSTDTFQNSSILPLDHAQCNGSILKRDETDDGQSQNTVPHSNINHPDGQVPHSIQHYHKYGHLHQPIVEEGDWSSSSSVDVEIMPFNQLSCSLSSAKDTTTTPKSTKKKKKSLPPMPVTKKKAPADVSPSKRRQKSPTKKPKQSSSPRSPKRKPHTKRSPKPKAKDQESNMLNDSAEMSYISSKWTSTNFASNPTKSSGNWANLGLDLSSWQSSDDDSSVEKPQVAKHKSQQAVVPVTNQRRFPKRQSNWKSPLLFQEEERKVELDTPSFPAPQVATLDDKPRSAYDKDADWYCGSDDDKDSIVSDGSSVLSAFRPKKNPPATSTVPVSEASLDFGALLGDEEQGSSEALKEAEKSMGLDFLLQSEDHGQLETMSGILPNFDDASTQSFCIAEDTNEPLKTSDFTDVEAPKQQTSLSRSVIASETESCSQLGSAASMGSFDADEETIPGENVETLSKRLCSKQSLRFIVAGVVSFFVIDIVLLSVFLARRN